MDTEKPGIATWLFCIYFHFSAIIFHVDSCESYATLDMAKGEKSGIYPILLLQYIAEFILIIKYEICFEIFVQTLLFYMFFLVIPELLFLLMLQ